MTSSLMSELNSTLYTVQTQDWKLYTIFYIENIPINPAYIFLLQKKANFIDFFRFLIHNNREEQEMTPSQKHH